MKRKIAILTVIILTVSIIWGCSREEAKVAALAKRIKPVPDFAAGTWVERGKDTTWRMVIEPNGIVSSAVIPLMLAVVRPYQTSKVEMVDGNFSTFTGGDMFSEYKPNNRELFVFIEVKKFEARIQDVRTGGDVIYRFTGPVSQDGKEWKPDNITIADYGPEFPIDSNELEPMHLVFDKVEGKQEPADKNH